MSPVEKEQSKISIPIHLRGRHDVITQDNSLITMKIAKNINRGIVSDFSLKKNYRHVLHSYILVLSFQH